MEKYGDIKYNKYSNLSWKELNDTYTGFECSTLNIQREKVKYDIQISLFHSEKAIVVSFSKPVELEKMYWLIGELRRYEYLVDGAFYVLKECTADTIDITDTMREVEVGYFQCAKHKHKIPVILSDADYKKYFIRWIKLEKQLGIINQMTLYASNVNGLPADVRISMLTECFEALAKKLEKKKVLQIEKEPNTSRQVRCSNCGHTDSISIPGKKTLKCCLLAILEQYGKPVFATEFRRRKSLVNHIIKTRNKVFHVNAKQKESLKGSHSGFYAIKLEWMYRYIIWVLLGVDKNQLNQIVGKQIEKFERVWCYVKKEPVKKSL